MVQLSMEQIAGIVKYHGASTGASFATSLYKPDTDGPIFVAIAMRESSGETTATNKNRNGTTDYGLWQINSVHKELLDAHQPWSSPDQNFRMAATLYQGRNGDFTDWTSYKDGTYAPFLPQATIAWGNPDTSAAQGNPISDAANTTYSAATATGEFLATLTKSETWIRIGMGAAGVLLLIIAVAGMLSRRLPAVLPGPLGMAARAMKKAA